MLETNLCTAFKGLYKKLLTTAALAFALFTIFAVFNQADVIYAKADSVTILDSDSTEASDGCVFLGAYGTYYTDAQAALDRINEIRYEACVEGVPNPNNTSESLTLDDYVPLKWSSTLEKIARIRASEASFTMAHARLNSQSIFSVSYDSMTASCEDLAWDNVNVDTMVYAVNLWYDEKSDYIGVCDGSIVKTSSIQIGHYESLINPKYTYIGLGDFYNTSAPYSNTTAAAMSRTSKELDSTMLPGAEDVIQKIEVKESYIDNYYISGAKEVGLGKTKKLQAKASVTYGKYTSDLYCIEDISYTSSDTSVLTVDADGNVTGISYGTATVKAYSGDTELASSEITVNCANGCDLGDYDSNYQVSGTCDICGNSSTYTVPSTMLVYFKNSTTEGNTYSSAVPSSNPLGSYISCWLNYINGDEGYSDILVECSNPDILEVPERLTGMSFYHFQVKGIGTVKLTLTPEYNTKLKKSYTVKVGTDGSISITDTTINLEYTKTSYTGSAQTPSVSVTYKGLTINSDSNYSISYTNNTDAGTATVTIKGLGVFTDTVTKTFEIEQLSLGDNGSIILESDSLEYNAKAQTPGVTVKYNSSVLTADTDYTVEYKNNTDIGTATITVTGINNYSGSLTADFTISHTTHALGDATVYKAADCENSGESRRTCLYCDYYESTEISAIGHSYKDTVVASTCTTKGYTTHVCSVCSDSYTDSYTELLAHSYKDTVVAPTCTTKGYTTHVCSVCSDSYTDSYTELLAHSYKDTVVAPTCTSKGYTTHVCSVCSDSYTDSYTDLVDHTVVTDAAVAATCTTTGLTEGSHCSVCKTTLKAQEKVAATGHSYKDTVVAPTCTTKGYTTHVCNVCSDSYTDSYTELLAHSYKDTVVAPTCTTKGYTTHVCSVCSDSYTDSYTDLVDHTVVTDAAVAATCTTTGLTEGSHCSVCKTTLKAQEKVAATGHSYKDTVVASTCTSKGYTTHVCSVCSESYTDSYTELLAHSYKDTVVAPTCTTKGYTTHVCSVCSDSYTDSYTDLVDHTIVTDAAVRATCSSTGLTEGSHCSVCGKVFVAQEITYATPGTGHSYYITTVAPTCSEQGYNDYVCKYCGDSFKDQIVDKIAHTPVTDSAIAPTCDATGLTEGSHCSVCNTVIVAQEIISKSPHDYELISYEWSDDYHTCKASLKCKNYDTHSIELELTVDQETEEDAKCDEAGVVKFTATGNADGLDLSDTKTAQLDVIGHYYKGVVTAPTCTEKGYTTYTCLRCGDSYVAKYTDILEHTAVKDEAVESTCTGTGLTEGSHCSVCGKTLIAQELVPMLAHTAVKDEAVESTCTSFGLTEGSHCLVCNTVITAQKEIAKKAHTIVTDKAVAATCTTDGLTEGSHCSVCNYTFVYQTVIPATGHSYTTKKVAATTTSTGYTLYTCSVCGYSYKGNVTPKLSSGISLTKPSVTLANSTSGVKVTWSKVSGANGYIVYRKTPGGKFAVLKRITNSSTTTYTDTTAKAGTTYYYTVKAYSGSKYSSYETNQKIKYIKQPTVTLTNQSKGVKVTWTRTVGASGYYIYRKTANGKFVKIKTITSGSTVTFTDTTAKAGTTYYYTVKAYGKSGSKTYTSSYVANKTIKRLTQPSVTLTKVSNGIKITWSKITGASGYYVYRKTANGKFTKIKTITSGSTVYFTDKTAKSGTTYYYTVRAYSGNSLSSYVTNKSIKYKK